MKRSAPLAGLILALLLAAASVGLSETGHRPRPASTKRGAGSRTATRSHRTAKDLPRPRLSSRSDVFRVSRVIDGDTFKLDNEERVRLLGVDTPETHHPKKPVQYYGPEASAFTKREIEKRLVLLEFDRTFRDRYGRILAYVFRQPDEFFLNAELIKQGYGYAYTRFPFARRAEFLRYEAEAKAGQRGLWAPRPAEPNPPAVH